MRVVITEECAGTGQCVAIAPEVFELDDDGLSTVTEMPDTQELMDAARSAAGLCPMAAIQLHE